MIALRRLVNYGEKHNTGESLSSGLSYSVLTDMDKTQGVGMYSQINLTYDQK